MTHQAIHCFENAPTPARRRPVAGVVFKWLGYLVGLFFCLNSAWAQPSTGSVYRGFLPMGSGASAPLPEGQWRVLQMAVARVNPALSFDRYLLKNEQPNTPVRLVVVSQSIETSKWGNTGCQNNNPSQFMIDEHGSKPNQLLNKCSRVFANNFEDFKTIDKWNTPQGVKDWWLPLAPTLESLVKEMPRNLLLSEMRVQYFGGRALQLEAFIQPPKGVSPIKFRDDFRANRNQAEHELLRGWNSLYVEAIHQSFFDKKPQAVMALSYALDSGIVTAQPNKVVAPAGLVAVAPALNASAAPSAALGTPGTSAADRMNLDRERKAAEEEKQKLAQQLEAMSKMLAKLREENAAAATLAEARAKQAPPGPEKIQALPLMANRKALVIGNDLYTNVSKLNNAGADAEAISKSLEAVGYKVFKHLNVNQKSFRQVIRDFKQQVTGGDEVLVFYAGHGVQLGNANYLLPTDIQGDSEDQVKDEAILLQRILDDLEDKKAKFALAVIDACRDNPFKGKGRALGGRGLAPTTAATGQMIMFSAGSGQQALDRLGDKDTEKNGLFTRIFVKEMQKPGVSVDRVLRTVRNEVVRLAKSVGHEQTPALYDQSIGEFYFRQ